MGNFVKFTDFELQKCGNGAKVPPGTEPDSRHPLRKLLHWALASIVGGDCLRRRTASLVQARRLLDRCLHPALSRDNTYLTFEDRTSLTVSERRKLYKA